MKKIFFSLIALICAIGANADTAWDFTSVNDADYSAMANDPDNWKKDAEVDRYGNAKALQNASLMAGNAELDFAKGILFTVTKPTASESTAPTGVSDSTVRELRSPSLT